MKYYLENGTEVQLNQQRGSGGEARIFTIVGNSQQLAKIYHKPDSSRFKKIQVMLENPPQELDCTAWPTALLYDEQQRFAGFLMPAVKNAYDLLKLYNPQDRKLTFFRFNWKYLWRTAQNLADATQQLHNKGYVIGDLNESNILVTSNALIILIDCDSVQVTVAKSTGQTETLRCTVGKPEYTPPELQSQNFSQVDRQPEHDNFALATIIFLLLMEGNHPFQGIVLQADENFTIAENIRSKRFAYANSTEIKPPRFAPSFNILPIEIQEMFLRCFVLGCSQPELRPTAAEWQETLAKVEPQIKQCRKNNQHWYSQHLAACPWCERVKKGLPDSFPAKRPVIAKVGTNTNGKKFRRPKWAFARNLKRKPVSSRYRRQKRNYFYILFIASFIFCSSIFRNIVTTVNSNSDAYNSYSPSFTIAVPNAPTMDAYLTQFAYFTPIANSANLDSTANPFQQNSFPTSYLLPTNYLANYPTAIFLPTATPEPTPIPTIISVEKTYAVILRQTNLYQDHSENSSVIKTLEEGSVVTLDERTQFTDWWYITDSNGWVENEDIKTFDSIDAAQNYVASFLNKSVGTPTLTP